MEGERATLVGFNWLCSVEVRNLRCTLVKAHYILAPASLKVNKFLS